jgi:hypothetical protein
MRSTVSRIEGLRQGRGNLEHGPGLASILMVEHMCIKSVLFGCPGGRQSLRRREYVAFQEMIAPHFAVAVYYKTSTLANQKAAKSRVQRYGG